MIETANGLAALVEQLSNRVRELEQRVYALEGRPKPESGNSSLGLEVEAEPASSPLVVVANLPIARAKPPATWRGFPPAEKPGGAVAVFGKAVLGIAGAYLLRAIAESGTMPKLPVLLAAIVYSCLWMVWAVRSHTAGKVASITYGVTSALILSPLLWESTIRFHVLSPAFGGAVLVAFVALALGLSWRDQLQAIPWIATFAAVSTAFALLIETRELVPLTAALLAIALAVEIAACCGRDFMVRPVSAIAADLSVAVLVFLLTPPESVAEGFRPATPLTLSMLCLALLAIYSMSIGIRVFVKRKKITLFEIVQGVLAFAIATVGALRATRESLGPELGVVFLVLTAACYWGALSQFLDESQNRNRRVAATWAALLLIAGSLLLFPSALLVPFLCLAAAMAAWVYTRTGKFSLGLHASLFLVTAAAVSPLPGYLVNALALTVPGVPEWGAWTVAMAAAACYAIGARHVEDKRRRRLLWVLPALVVGFTAAAFVVAAIVRLAGGQLEIASRLSVVRTIVNCALAIVLAFLGSRWKRVELGWVAYTAVVFGTLKLLFEDLRLGNAASLVVSLLFYGSVLILLPRMMQRERSAIAGHSPS
jgi:hypothetical protein